MYSATRSERGEEFSRMAGLPFDHGSGTAERQAKRADYMQLDGVYTDSRRQAREIF
jgi:hypothetical protein